MYMHHCFKRGRLPPSGVRNYFYEAFKPYKSISLHVVYQKLCLFAQSTNNYPAFLFLFFLVEPINTCKVLWLQMGNESTYTIISQNSHEQILLNISHFCTDWRFGKGPLLSIVKSSSPSLPPRNRFKNIRLQGEKKQMQVTLIEIKAALTACLR